MSLSRENETGSEAAEEQLRYRPDFISALTDSLGEGVYALDREGRVTFMNPAAERMLGWKFSELCGQHVHEAIHFQRADGTRTPAAECPLLGVMESKTTLSGDDVFTRKDGSLLHISYTSSPIITDGEVTGAVLAFRDISERKRAEQALLESEERYRTVAETASDAIITIDAESNILFINPAAERIFGHTVGEMVGQSLTMLMPDYMRHLHREGLTHYVETGHKHISWSGVELPGLHKRGHEIPLEVSFSETMRDGKHYFTGIARDITERKHAEEAVLRARDEMEMKVTERTAELSRANAILEEQIAERQRAEDELQKEREFLSALLDNLAEGIVACNAEGILTLFNRATREFHGLPKEQLPAERWGEHYDLYQADGQTQMKTADIPLFRALAGQHVRDVEMVIAPKGGAARTLLANGQPILDGDGRKLGAVVAMHDITERKHAEEERARFVLDRAMREQMLEELSTPLVPVWKDVLVLPIIGSLDTERMERATDAALREVTKTCARVCIIDITGARIIDSHAVAQLSNLVSALKLIGAEALVTGIGAHAAHSLVTLGLDLQGMRTHRTLAEALAAIIKTTSNNL